MEPSVNCRGQPDPRCCQCERKQSQISRVVEDLLEEARVQDGRVRRSRTSDAVEAVPPAIEPAAHPTDPGRPIESVDRQCRRICDVAAARLRLAGNQCLIQASTAYGYVGFRSTGMIAPFYTQIDSLS